MADEPKPTSRQTMSRQTASRQTASRQCPSRRFASHRFAAGWFASGWFVPRRRRTGGRVRYAPPEARLRVGRALAGLVSSLSHDFIQPLSTVTSLADLLATDWTELPDDMRRDLAVRVDAGARGLAPRYRHLIIVMDVLGGRAVPGNAVSVRESVDTAVASMPEDARIGVSGPAARALMDRDHLDHVLTTLIADALTHGAPPVRVRIVPAARTIRIEVSDHGQDVMRRTSAHVLSPVTGRWTVIRRESTHSRALGLAMAARLIATDGGAISHRPMRRPHGERVVIRLAIATESESDADAGAD